MKDLTYHINNYAYTIKLGEDPDNVLEDALTKFLRPEDRNLSIEDLLLAYLNKTQEFITFQEKLKTIMMTIPSKEHYENKGLFDV